MTNLVEERINEENYNRYGTLMKIVEYNNAIDIIVEFQDEHRARVHTSYQGFKKGEVKNPYDKTAYNVGYLGQGKYKAKINNKKTKAYEVWKKMLQRCYDPYTINKQLTYKDCFVCEEWHNFQNFCKWFYKNYYEIEGEKMCLDKDILCKGNKIYSPETCIFVPQRINNLFLKSNVARGKYPIGVHWYKSSNKFMAHCQILDKENNKKAIHLGYYNTSEEAFLSYKVFKEKYIKEVADEYKDLIPQKLYDVLYSYEVEIND